MNPRTLVPVLVSLLLVGCSDMQPSPVAPSAVIPAGPTTAIAPVALPSLPVPVPIPSPPPPVETPTPPAPAVVVMGAGRIFYGPGYSEWLFSVTSGDTLSNYVWSFGDGAGDSGARTTQHKYIAEGHYTVRVTADSVQHGQVTTTREIVAKFD